MAERPIEYHVTVSERAAAMLASHAAFLAQSSPGAADRLIAAFERAAGSLRGMPGRSPFLRGDYIPPNRYRTLLFEKRYLLIYQIVENRVYIDYVVDCRQDYEWLIQSR